MSSSHCHKISPLPMDYELPLVLNNPFKNEVPLIAKVAAKGLQTQLSTLFKNHPDFKSRMYGVLVVQDAKSTIGYLSAYSGSIAHISSEYNFFVPSQFNTSDRDHFLSVGLTQLSELSQKIKSLEMTNQQDKQLSISSLKEERKSLSQYLQIQLFDNYSFINRHGENKKLLHIFHEYSGKKPPAGAGECAAPKLLQYAYSRHLTPIAIAEFWWGPSTPAQGRVHKKYYPACENKCRPILHHMLDI